MRWVRMLAVRAVGGLATLVVLSVLVFAATEVLPGDPARAQLPAAATAAEVSAERARLHLERPPPRRYLDWLGAIARGDLGRSFSGRPVSALVGPAARASLILAGVALVVLVPLELVLGVAAGLRAGRALDHAVGAGALLALAIPPFVIAAALVLVLAVGLGWLPAESVLDPDRSALAQPSLLVIPGLALLAGALAFGQRLIRAATIEALGSEHVAAARLRGVPERRVVLVHALPAVGPVAVQALAITVVGLLSGAVVVEVVVGYPGVGTALQSAVGDRDAPVVQAIAMLLAAVVVLANLVCDVAVRLLVPRLRTAPAR